MPFDRTDLAFEALGANPSGAAIGAGCRFLLLDRVPPVPFCGACVLQVLLAKGRAIGQGAIMEQGVNGSRP